MNTCNRCGEIMLYSENCLCKPYIVIDEDGEEHQVYANGRHDAALRYAKKSNIDGDHYLMENSTEITVKGEKYVISAEPDVYYSARPLIV